MELIDRWIPNPAHEREELRGVLGEMQRDAGRRPPKRPLERCPPTISASIWSDLRGTLGERVGFGGSIRRLHNFYGWTAKVGAKRGHCAGAL